MHRKENDPKNRRAHGNWQNAQLLQLRFPLRRRRITPRQEAARSSITSPIPTSITTQSKASRKPNQTKPNQNQTKKRVKTLFITFFFLPEDSFLKKCLPSFHLSSPPFETPAWNTTQNVIKPFDATPGASSCSWAAQKLVLTLFPVFASAKSAFLDLLWGLPSC